MNSDDATDRCGQPKRQSFCEAENQKKRKTGHGSSDSGFSNRNLEPGAKQISQEKKQIFNELNFRIQGKKY
jgi:hypothetical protein